MKTKIKPYAALFSIITVLIFGCSDNQTETIKLPGEAQQRIIGKETTQYKGYFFCIIQVDGIEYLTCPNGGFIQLPKDTLKKQ